MKRLIVLRGNSGSGKTTTAKLLQEKLGRKTMLLSKDTLRREVLRAKDHTNHPGGQLMQMMTRFGWEHGYDTVIVEGIWTEKKYGDELRQIISESDESYVYYFDLSFEETLRRHDTKQNKHEFGAEEMRQWWKEKDFLRVESEYAISEGMSQEEIVQKILVKIGIIRM